MENRASVVRSVGWTPPYPGCFKFKTDASYREHETRKNTYIGSSSLIIFNDEEEIVFAYVRRSREPTNAFVEEVKGIENVVLLFDKLEPDRLRDNGNPQIIVVCDSQDAVKVVTGARNLRTTGVEATFYDKTLVVITHIRKYLRENEPTNVHLIWNERERNHCADEATKTHVSIDNVDHLIEIKGGQTGGSIATLINLQKVWPTYRAQVTQDI